jgi:hypothetical protein
MRIKYLKVCILALFLAACLSSKSAGKAGRQHTPTNAHPASAATKSAALS